MNFSNVNMQFPPQMRPHMSMYGGKTYVCGKYTNKELEDPSQVQFAGLHKATICLDELSTNVNDVNEINDMLNVTQLK